jgi:hypothetical protein
MQAAAKGNNGQADVPCLSNGAVQSLLAAGYSVVASNRVYFGGHTVTKPGIAICAPAEPGQSTLPLPDFEAGILSRQSLSHLF